MTTGAAEARRLRVNRVTRWLWVWMWATDLHRNTLPTRLLDVAHMLLP